MVSASKMRKSVETVLKTRTYANLSWRIVLNLARSMENGHSALHPFFEQKRAIKNIIVILVTSNRGLCAGFNSAIVSMANEEIKRRQNEGIDKNAKYDFILIGKKGRMIHKYFGYDVAAEFSKADFIDKIEEVLPVISLVSKDFYDGKYDKIMVAYTDYISATKQVAKFRQLLPIDINSPDEIFGITGDDAKVGITRKFLQEKQEESLKTKSFHAQYIFEPNAKEVLDELMSRLLEIQLFQAILESNAAEHSARMTAMHQATDAAQDMVSELTLSYNKARQASITNEIAEISAGANALK